MQAHEVFLFKNKSKLQQTYKSLYMWISPNNKLKIISQKNLKIINQKNRAVFRRTRFFSNVVMQHAIGSLTDYKLKKELQEEGELQEMESGRVAGNGRQK